MWVKASRDGWATSWVWNRAPSSAGHSAILKGLLRLRVSEDSALHLRGLSKTGMGVCQEERSPRVPWAWEAEGVPLLKKSHDLKCLRYFEHGACVDLCRRHCGPCLDPIMILKEVLSSLLKDILLSVKLFIAINLSTYLRCYFCAI